MKQKALFLLLAMFLVGTVANAQIVTSKSRLVTKVKKTPFEKTLYLAVGGQMVGVTNQYYKFRPGGEAALGYQMGFKRGKKFGSQWGIEAGLTTRGYKYEQPYYATVDQLNPTIFFSPFNYVYRIGVGEGKKTWIEPHVGVFVGFDPANDVDHDGLMRLGGGSGSTWFQSLHYETGNHEIDGGVNLGIRFWFAKRVSVDLSYRQFIGPEFGREGFRVTPREYVAGQWQSAPTIEECHKGRAANICLRIGVKFNK
ncbi:MAG: hypothetical protein IJ064_03590 [Bacteroidaceae bacterium]|nr:hypothetical protein [Bacteroidaceae bacterium]